MPRRKRVHPDALLLTYQEAAWILGCELPEFMALLDRGLIQPHPALPGKVTRASVIDLALESSGAEDHEAGGWAVHDGPAPQERGTSSLRLRQNAG